MHRRDLESLLDPGIGVVASVSGLSAWRTEQHSGHRHSGARYCHAQSFESLSLCHLIFLSTFLRGLGEPFGGHGTDGERVAAYSMSVASRQSSQRSGTMSTLGYILGRLTLSEAEPSANPG